MRMSPLSILLTCSTLGLAGMLAAIWLAMQIPLLQAEFQIDPSGNRLMIHTSELDHEPLRSLGTGTQHIPAVPALLIEDMDALPDYAARRDFLDGQQFLINSMQQGSLQLTLDDGQTLSLPVLQRAFTDLPFMFWFQMISGYLGLIIGSAVWAFSRQKQAALPLAIMGLGLAMAAWSAGIYSTRGLAMDANWFRLLGSINHLGAILYACMMSALLWRYPLPMRGDKWIGMTALFTASMIWGADTLALGSTPNITFFIPFFIVFLSSILLAVRQWRASACDPVARAALGWLLLSVFFGTVLFSGLSMLPMMLTGHALLGSQGLLMGALALVHLGLALGIIRYRLFDIGQWWFAVWSWLVGGMLVIALDFLLLSLWVWPQTLALPVTMLIAGLIYFPLRQWLWQRLMRHPEPEHELFYTQLAAMCSQPDKNLQIETDWSSLLASMFSPMEIIPQAHAYALPQLLNNGSHLQVPALIDESSLLLGYPAKGKRLFTQVDVRMAEHYITMGRNMLSQIREKQAATRLERQRIMNDLHDELGGKLLELSYQSSESPVQSLARSAIQDMRDLVHSSHEENLVLDHVLSDLRGMIASQTELADIMLKWGSAIADDTNIAGWQALHLRRIIKEAVTNVIRHAQATEIVISIALEDGLLLLSIADNGGGLYQTQSKGSGLMSMRQRAEKLAGEIRWENQPEGGCKVSLQCPLS